jgi:hypothetical protein
MPEPDCTSLEEALLDLERTSPNVPILALGQTVFWDEPMKAGVAMKIRKLGLERKFVAGVHDSDYFAKIPSGRTGQDRFRTLPHNDTSTRGLWSAAGEFSTLFGSETVVTREALAAAGVKVDSVERQRPRFLDEITEAWGWRGIVSLEEFPPVTAELPLDNLFPELLNAFKWAWESTLEALGGQGKQFAGKLIDDLLVKIHGARARSTTLSGFYRLLLPVFYEFAANASVPMETTTTTELLKFNPSTCHLPRFEILGLFVNEATRATAVQCYNDAIKGSSGLYELSRFGTGSVPFDIIIPKLGRGTIRLGKRGAVIMTIKKQFLSYKKPLASLSELADLVQKKFGPDCAIVGKAVSLIGMLGREFVFCFHEGASAYVKHSRTMHRMLAERLGLDLPIHPLLRVRYSAWDSLNVCCSWLRLPEIIQRPFGTEELCAPSFSARWKEVGDEQRQLLASLTKIRRPIELIRYLDATLGGSWRKLAEEYESLHSRLQLLSDRLKELHNERDQIHATLCQVKQRRIQAELAKGKHFRAFIFEKDPDPVQFEERKRLTHEVEEIIETNAALKADIRRIRSAQHLLANDPEVRTIHERRRSIELEAELKRARLVRSAIVASKGLTQASVRPSAWWFPLVCPDGLWFRETVESSQAYLEPLI